MTGPNLTGQFGYTPWGRDFLRIVEPMRVTRPDPLLPRARSLARASVTDVAIEGRLIRGTVARGGQASVAYAEFAPIDREHSIAATELLGPTPAVAELSDSAHRALGLSGPELVSVDCSCRARTERCIHVLALLYDTVRRIDEDPRLALSLRGFPESTTVEGSAASTRIIRWQPLSTLDPAGFYG